MDAIAILPGHGHKTEYDPGTVSPAGWAEADVVRAIAVACLADLPASRIAGAGSYRDRGAWLARMLPGVPVVQLHADATAAETSPDRATIWTWPGNARSRHLADLVRAELSAVVPWPVRVLEASATIGWHANARACLGAVAQDSILIEVGYADGAQGRHLIPGLCPAIGAAIARGVRGYR